MKLDEICWRNLLTGPLWSTCSKSSGPARWQWPGASCGSAKSFALGSSALCPSQGGPQVHSEPANSKKPERIFLQ